MLAILVWGSFKRNLRVLDIFPAFEELNFDLPINQATEIQYANLLNNFVAWFV